MQLLALLALARKGVGKLIGLQKLDAMSRGRNEPTPSHDRRAAGDRDP
jgi:hypothetical protein